MEFAQFDWFYKRIGRFSSHEGSPQKPLNSLGFISELAASEGVRIAADPLQTLQIRYVFLSNFVGDWDDAKRLYEYSLCFISEFNEWWFCWCDFQQCKFAMFYKRIQWIRTSGDCHTRIRKFAMFYKRIQRMANLGGQSLNSLNSIGFISEWDGFLFRLAPGIRPWRCFVYEYSYTNCNSYTNGNSSRRISHRRIFV